jgi:hypothetical protein
VQARLVGEAGPPGVGLAGGRQLVGDLTDRVGHPGQVGELAGGQHPQVVLGLQVADQGDQIGVAGAFPVAVDGALDLDRPGLHRGQRVGHRAAGVVVAVDTQRDADPGGGADDLGDHRGQHPAVGVAQHGGRRPGLGGRAHHFEGVVRVEPVAVEEVLAVDHHLAAQAHQIGHGVGDHRQVLGQGGAQRLLHMTRI